jgi:hypothetical protein
MFIRCNQRLSLFGFTTIDVPPTNMAADAVDDAGFQAADGPPFALTFDVTAPSSLYVSMTPPLSPGITNFTKYLRTLGVFDQATVDTDVTAAYVARFGTPVAVHIGKRIGLNIAGFNDQNGQISVPLVSSALIT